jgi:crossover junction endodeoxyribonuclease RusA
MNQITLVLPVPISANLYWRSFPIGKRIMTAPSNDAKKYKNTVGMIARAAGVRQPIVGRVAIHVDYFPQRPLDWAKRSQKNPDNWDDTVRALDVDNISKCLLDSLKNIAFEDDKFVWRYYISRQVPDSDARVVVTITPLRIERVQPSLLEAAS